MAFGPASTVMNPDTSVFRAMAEASPAGIGIISWSDKRVKWLNAACNRFLEKNVQEKGAVGMHITEVIPDFVESGLEKIFQRVADTGTPFSMPEYEHFGFSRGVTYWNWSLIALPAESGQVPDLMIQAIEMTSSVLARKRIEALAHDAEQQRRIFDTALSSTPDHSYIFDLNARFLYANRATTELLQQTPQSIIGKNFSELNYPAELSVTLNQQIRHVIATKQQIREGMSFIAPSGEAGYYEYILVPVISKEGDVEAVAGTTRDITERKRLEETLRCSEDSERAARTEATRSVKLKDEFLATLSHELRTPLNAIYGWTQLLQLQGNEPEKLSKGLEVIYRNANLQKQLIDDLLDMNRIMSGKVHLDIQQVDLNEIIQAAIEVIIPEAQAGGVVIESHVESALENIYGDPARLQQIIWNLLSNAVKFTPSGGKVNIAVQPAKSEIKVSVTDTGMGISQDFLPFVFDRFRQSDSSAKRQYGGLGLGLSIASTLAKMHNGCLIAESEGLGRGARFTLSIPSDAPYLEKQYEAQLDGAGNPSCGNNALQGMKILVVDDEADARELLCQILAERKAEVAIAKSAEEARELVATFVPEFIISDIGMPVEDGYDFISSIRNQGITTPAIALTAFGRAEERARSAQAGFQAHLTKPFMPNELLSCIASLAPDWTRNASR